MAKNTWYDYSHLPAYIEERLEPRFRLAAAWTMYAPIENILRMRSEDIVRTMSSMREGAVFDKTDVKMIDFPEGRSITVSSDLFARTSGYWFESMIERCNRDPSLTEEQVDEVQVFADVNGYVNMEAFNRALVDAM